LISGCNKLRIKDIPGENYDSEKAPYRTSQFNFERNAYSAAELSPPLKPVWDETFIALPSRGFTVIEDWIFFGTINGYLSAANLNDGDAKGKRNLGDSCPVPPTVWKNMIYQPYELGNHGLIAYNINDGSPVWSLDDNLSPSSPVIANNRIYHKTSYSMIFCLEQKTGRMVWQKFLNQKTRSSLAFNSELLITASMDGDVTALDHLTGGTRWQVNLGGPIFADPVISGEIIYIVNYGGQLFALDMHSGKTIRSHRFGIPLYHGPSVDQNRVYLGLSNGQLVSMDKNSFEILYTFSGEGPVAGPPLVTDSYVYYTTLSRFLYILDKTDLVLLQDIEFESRVRSTPIITNGKLVIACEDDRAIALSPGE
jgi:outer membrane protein assembly factor BamB